MCIRDSSCGLRDNICRKTLGVRPTEGIDLFLYISAPIRSACSCALRIISSFLAVNDVLEVPSVTAARVDDQLRVRLNKRVIERVVVGGNDGTVHPGEHLCISFHGG